MLTTPTQMLRLVGRLPMGSQHTARHNALVASTALAERRRERLEVEEFLARLDALPAQARLRGDVRDRPA